MVGAAVLATALAACTGGGSGQPVTPGGMAGAGQINGAGATFPYPLYSKWFSEYAKAHPEVRINYQSIGSGGGIRQLVNRTVFFGASDAPMTDKQMAAAPGPILHFPTTIGAVVPIYNLGGSTAALRFSGPLLADVFLGRVTTWNDPAIARENRGARLPDTAIVAIHRSDGSGTNYVFCEFLARQSPEFAKKVGVATSVSWPGGLGAKGNEGVAGLVQQTPGAIGYVELVYALQNRIPFAAVRNRAGRFVEASLESVTAAAASANVPPDFRVSITDPPGTDAYPIASFTWILLFEKPEDRAKARQMVEFMRWALSDGQKLAGPLGYAPLPEIVAAREIEALGRIQTP